MKRTPFWRQLTVVVFSLFVLVACEKQTAEEAEAIAVESPFVSLESAAGVAYCGQPFSTPLQAGNNAGNNVGTAVVGNDADYLYLAYTLDPANDFYLQEVQGFAGLREDLPVNKGGMAAPGQFPYKQTFTNCDLKKSAVFKVPKSALKSKSGADCLTQCYVAMHATVVQIANKAECATATRTETAWGVGDRISPDKGYWGMGFTVCQTAACEQAWCSMSQGYWFAKPRVTWNPEQVSFSHGAKSLTVTKDKGRALWPAKSNWVRKAFFQASALQLSIPMNGGRAVHSSIAPEYTTLCNFLAGLTYADIEAGRNPNGANEAEIQNAAGKIGKWICQNHCNPMEDASSCEEN